MISKGICSAGKWYFRFSTAISSAFVLIISLSCSAVTAASPNFTEERLRARIVTAWSHFVTGNFDAYVSMWSERKRPGFRETEEDWQKTVRNWKLFITREQPALELLAVQITGRQARATMRASTLEEDGSRGSDIVYDYWVFENGDWFLDDANRTK